MSMQQIYVPAVPQQQMVTQQQIASPATSLVQQYPPVQMAPTPQITLVQQPQSYPSFIQNQPQQLPQNPPSYMAPIQQNSPMVAPTARNSSAMTYQQGLDPFRAPSDIFEANIATVKSIRETSRTAVTNDTNTIIGQCTTNNGEVENVVWYCPKSHEELHNNYNHLCDTVSGRFLRFCLLAVPGFLLTWNAFHLDDCPYNHMLPVWGISTGTLWIVYTMLYFLFRNHEEREQLGCRFLMAVFVYASVGWFITGSVWVFGGMDNVDFHIDTKPHYCEIGVYFTCLVVLLIGYVFIVIYLFFSLFTFQYNNQPTIENL